MTVTGVELLTSWGGFPGLSVCFSSLCALALWLSLCLGTHSLWGVGEAMERCSGSVQTHTQPVHPILL